MLIDWFTVGAQALNFIVLVWLLKRFLYKPILNAVDAREQRIAAQLADANTKQAQAQKEREEFQNKIAEFEQQRAALLSQANKEAASERQHLIEEARVAAASLSAQRQEALRREAGELQQALRRRTQAEVFAIARKVMTDLSTCALEERICEVFIKRLRTLEGSAKAAFATVLNSAPDPALVRSAFELPAGQRVQIQHALNETFAADVPIRFEVAPDLIGGIELSRGGQKLAWSITEYLAAMEQTVAALLQDMGRSESK
ncbi:MAG: F0F1 ATP synthase subunit delta [Steroidobacteraceae bacterium]